MIRCMAFFAGAVTCFFYSRNNSICRSGPFHTHGVGQKADGTGSDALALSRRLFLPGRCMPRSSCLLHYIVSYKNLLISVCYFISFWRTPTSSSMVFVFALPDIICYTGPDMLGQKDFIKAVKGGVDGRYLDQDIRTVTHPPLPFSGPLLPGLRYGLGGLNISPPFFF